MAALNRSPMMPQSACVRACFETKLSETAPVSLRRLEREEKRDVAKEENIAFSLPGH